MQGNNLRGLGLIALGLLIAGAAFIGGRYLNASNAGNASIFGDGSIRPAKAVELPAGEPDVVGLVVKRADNIVSIGTNVEKFHTVREARGQVVNREAGYAGPIVDIVVTHSTQIYRDVTPIGPGQAAQSGVIQQVLATASLDDMEQTTLLQVWGQRQGDRVVASVMVIMTLPL